MRVHKIKEHEQTLFLNLMLVMRQKEQQFGSA